MLRRRPVLALPALLLAAPVPAAAQALSDRDRADIARAEAWLNGLRNLKARFLQIAQGGAAAEAGSAIRSSGMGGRAVGRTVRAPSVREPERFPLGRFGPKVTPVGGRRLQEATSLSRVPAPRGPFA